MRKSKPLRLTAAGMRLLRLADKILPEVDAIQAEFEGLRSGKSGRLHIAIECHACFEWLFPVLEDFVNLGPMWMWISDQVWHLTPCQPWKKRM